MSSVPRTPAEYREWWAENTEVPYGYCWCKCGGKTRLAPQNTVEKGWTKDEPKRYVRGHATRKHHLFSYTVEDRGYKTPCWIWQGVLRSGYGRTQLANRTVSAHRVSYENRHGPIDPGIILHHLCEVRACINPDHLRQINHMAHMKGHRPNYNFRRSHDLSQEEVQEVRNLYATGLYRQHQIAELFWVGQATISRIVRHEGAR